MTIIIVSKVWAYVDKKYLDAYYCDLQKLQKKKQLQKLQKKNNYKNYAKFFTNSIPSKPNRFLYTCRQNPTLLWIF